MDVGWAERLHTWPPLQTPRSGCLPHRFPEQPHLPDPVDQPVRSRDGWGRQTVLLRPDRQRAMVAAASGRSMHPDVGLESCRLQETKQTVNRDLLKAA